MKNRFNTQVKFIACLLVLAPCLSAQEPGWEGAIKFRGGFQLGSVKDRLNSGMFGGGVEVGYATPDYTLAGEVGIYFKSGAQYPMDLNLEHTATGAQIDPAKSVDSRKSQLDGYYLRLSFEKPVGWISLRGGLEFANANFRQEYVADLQGTAPGGPFRDTYNGVIQKRTLAVSPFIGAKIPMIADQWLEVQVVGLTYTASSYLHVAGTVPEPAGTTGGHTGSDSTTENKRIIPHLEVAYCIRF